MKTNLLTLVITMTVGIILVGSLLSPILEDTEKDYKVTNGFGNLATLDDDVNDAISGVINQSKIEINSDSWTRGDLTYNWTCPLVADTFIVKTLVTSNAVSISFACIISGTSTILTTDSNSVATLAIEAEEGSASVTITYSDSTPDTSLTIPYTWVAYMDKDGDHVVQTLPWAGTFSYLAYYNNIEDLRGADFKSGSFYSYVGYDVTYGTTSYTASATTTDVSGVVNVHCMDNNGSNFKFNSINIGVIVAPLTVYGTTETMDGYAGLLNVLPLLLIVGILVGAVGFIALRRQD